MHDTPDSHQTTSSQEENREDAMQSGACMVHGAIGAMHQWCMYDHMIEIRNGHRANGG